MGSKLERRSFSKFQKKEHPKDSVKVADSQKGQRSNKYAAFLLRFAFFMDTVATMSLLPIVTLRTQILSFSASTVLLSQFLFFFPQLWSTLVVERFAERFGAFTVLAISFLATTFILFLTTAALHQGSIVLYLVTRLVAGLFRHPGVLGVLCFRELSTASKNYEMSSVAIPSFIATMLFGGFLGDYWPEIISITIMLGFIEFFIAVLVILVSFSRVNSQKTIPAVQTVKAYKNWLQQQHYGVIAASIPSAFVVFCASVIQCMYPFVDRAMFSLKYSIIGLHLAVVFGIQHIVAPAVVKRLGTGWLLLSTCSAVFVLGMYLNAWIKENDLFFYFLVTLLFTDFPAAVLEFSLDTIAERSFDVASITFAKKLHRHVKLTTKQWSTTLLFFIDIVFDGREDLTRTLTLPVAVGLAMFVFTRNLPFAFATIAAVVGALWNGFLIGL